MKNDNILFTYLKKLTSHLNQLIAGYESIIYTTEKDITTGLLRFDKPPKGKAFIFVFPTEKIREFHTVGMKFPINIFFFNKDEEIIFSYENVKPGIKNISSKSPCKSKCI
jgi:uncharacterized membrane protein (UPF0127 family)